MVDEIGDVETLGKSLSEEPSEGMCLVRRKYYYLRGCPDFHRMVVFVEGMYTVCVGTIDGPTWKDIKHFKCYTRSGKGSICHSQAKFMWCVPKPCPFFAAIPLPCIIQHELKREKRGRPGNKAISHVHEQCVPGSLFSCTRATRASCY